MSSSDSVRCEACNHQVVPVRPSPLWTLAFLGGFIPVLGGVVAAALGGLLMTAIVPTVLGMAAGFMPGLYAKMTELPECPDCHKAMPDA